MRASIAVLISVLAASAAALRAGGGGGGAEPSADGRAVDEPRRSVISGGGAETALRALTAGPMQFERNLGQEEDRRVEYLARGPGYGLFLAREEMALALEASRPNSKANLPANAATVVRMRWVDAERPSPLVGEQPLASRSNYVIGRDPSGWLYDVPHFGSVRYPRLYPGIDLVVHGQGREPQYDFVVAPGADPERIWIAFSGTEGRHIESTGNLVLQTAAGDIVHQAPFAFQVDDAGLRQRVAARFVLRDDQAVGFSLGEFDPTRELVIDPKVYYATLLGDVGKDNGFDVAEDGAGRIYVVGRATNSYPAGDQTNLAFVTKIGLRPAPNIIYTTFIGPQNGHAAATGVTVFGQEPHVVGGTFSRSDFPLTVNPSHILVRDANHKNWTHEDAFYVRLSASGKVMTSTLIGGHGDDEARDVAVRDGFAYIVGTTDSADFPRKAATGVPGGNEASSCKIAFLTKLDLGTKGAIENVVYSTYLPGVNPGNEWSRQSIAAAVGVDASGNAYVAGMRGADSVQNCSPHLVQNPFPVVWKVDPTGKGGLLSQFGGKYVTPYDIAVTSDGHSWVVGSVTAKTPPQLITVNPIQPNNAGGEDAFITKLTPSGSIPFSTYFGGKGDDRATGVALHPFAGVPYITGTTTSDDFPRHNEVSGAAALRRRTDPRRVERLFIMGLDAQNNLVFSTKYNGEHYGDLGPAIAADESGRAIIVGTTEKAGFAVTDNALQSEIRGGRDAFLVILSPDKKLVQTTPRRPRR